MLTLVRIVGHVSTLSDRLPVHVKMATTETRVKTVGSLDTLNTFGRIGNSFGLVLACIGFYNSGDTCQKR